MHQGTPKAARQPGNKRGMLFLTLTATRLLPRLEATHFQTLSGGSEFHGGLEIHPPGTMTRSPSSCPGMRNTSYKTPQPANCEPFLRVEVLFARVRRQMISACFDELSHVIQVLAWIRA
jgi:hypothetical protein